MAFQVSPGVAVKEIDLTNVIPAVSTSIGGFSGYFKWGPIGTVELISSENQLANRFGKPDSEAIIAEPYFQAASFLNYGTALKVVRAGTSAAGWANAGAGDSDSNSPAATDLFVPNEKDFEEVKSSTDASHDVIARYAGAFGNGLRVYIFNEAQFTNITSNTDAELAVDSPPNAQGTVDTETRTAAGVFDTSPGTGEIHVAIVDNAGNWGEAGVVVEKFSNLGISKTAKNADGSNNYFKTVINNSSEFIYYAKNDSGTLTVTDVTGHDASAGVDSPSTEASLFKKYTLTGGADASTLTTGDVSAGLDILGDAETEDVNLLFSQIDASGGVLQNKAHAVAIARKDAVAFLSPHVGATRGVTESAALTNVKTFADSTITVRGADGSYGVMDSSAVYIYDKYNDVFRYIPANGHIAGLCANTDSVADAWFSPAGFNRGSLRNVVKLAYNPKKADRDELYKRNVNPISAFPGQGIVLFGDKTAQSKPSAFDRINVRRLFITLEKAISTAAKFQLFELNDEFTRATFRNAVEPFLRDVQGRRGITDFLVVCDETNNTGQVIDTNRFVADIFIKPARSINFITLNFIATRTGVDFAEVAGLSNG